MYRKFDIKLAKTPENPDGLEVVGKNGEKVRIICTDRKSTSLRPSNIVILVLSMEGTFENTIEVQQDGTTYFTKLHESWYLQLVEKPKQDLTNE